jgi:hypothetical protein
LAGRKQVCPHVNAASALNINIVEDQRIARANAHLIAAAPDLLNALVMVLDDPQALDGRPRTAEVVREAVAKATGGAA